MSKRSNVICINNTSLFLICLMVLMILAFFYMIINKPINIKDTNNIRIETSSEPTGRYINPLVPSWPYTNLPANDVLLNPYAPPLSDERYMVPNAVPINVPTNIGAVSATYRQMGILTPFQQSSTDKILSLMGRPLFVNRDKWQYYTISNQHNNVKLPIIFKKKNGLNDYGVDQIYNGDVVYVEGYQHSFKATIYENDTIRYLPFL
jgi:hypothetical protein